MPRVFPAPEAFRRRHCPKGHDKALVGIESYNRSCWECHIATTRRNNRKRREAARRGRPPRWQDGTGVRRVREYLGLSKPAFARAIGCAVQTVYDWESGKKRMGMCSVERYTPVIARLLKTRGEEIRAEHDAVAQARRQKADNREGRSYAA